MNPRVWGKSFWVFLVSIAMRYSDKPSFEEVHNMRRFLTAIGSVLPCVSSCRPNYLRHLSEIPLLGYIESRQGLLIWLYQVYNIVLREQGRQPVSLEYFISKNTLGDGLQESRESLVNIVVEYPSKPSFDDIQNYKKFFTYLKDVYPIHREWIPIDKYLGNKTSLMKWLIYVYDIEERMVMESFSSGKPIGEARSLILLGALAIFMVSAHTLVYSLPKK